MIKFICKPKYDSQQNGVFSLEDVSKFPLIQNQLLKNDPIDLGEFKIEDIMTSIKLANNAIEIYDFLSMENIYQITNVYNFCCKYGCLQVIESIEQYIIECDYDYIITSDMYVFASMYSRQCIINIVNLMIKDETLDKDFFLMSDYEILKHLKPNQILDFLLLKYDLDDTWIFYIMNDIMQHNCQIETRHINSLNKLFIDACQDKKAEFYEDDVHNFLRFIESKGLNTEPIVINECCCDIDSNDCYYCNNHTYKIFCDDPEYN
ncbi:hypothetical protein [Bandra megavirus]|uniref:Uncharacterized protein n=1 Tax=Bandra megavirus TaxID=2071566 RepID=A0A2K9V9H9_9VIRU|nr:hypothetical protein [Bandra megavirus]